MRKVSDLARAIATSADHRAEGSLCRRNERLWNGQRPVTGAERGKLEPQPPWLVSVDGVGHSGTGILGSMHHEHELADSGLYGRLFPRRHVAGVGAARRVNGSIHRPKQSLLAKQRSRSRVDQEVGGRGLHAGAGHQVDR